ncbi:MAG TPA: FprA family A-type flavoprotein [Syntrophorhabdaceae bacterium]|nr:FprA family A-type flavoprotein [Syntrophorhabdaceae bacterium]
MSAIEIKPDIYWVGAVDWGIRDFHGYVTQNGTTYNNYLIKDRDITLVDSVKHGFADVSLENIRSVVDPAEVRNIVVNHIEPDHSSALDILVRQMPKAVIYISERGKKGLDRYFDTSKWNIKIVKNGEVLNIGKYSLTFLETPMLHWPDSMMTYVKEAKLLISQDAFGQHLASTERFDDDFLAHHSQYELDDAIVDYYANILMPFGRLIKTKIDEVVKIGLEIDMIAPDHGIIWRTHSGKVIQAYLDMANGKADPGVAIIYDTMWHSTELMIEPIVRGITEAGIACSVTKLRSTPMSFAVKELWKKRGFIVGVPTVNNSMFPSVAEFLYHLSGLKPKDRIAGAFGSYGWGGGAVKEVYERFKQMGLSAVEPGVQVVYKPSPAEEAQCYEFGKQFAMKVKDYPGQA